MQEIIILVVFCTTTTSIYHVDTAAIAGPKNHNLGSNDDINAELYQPSSRDFLEIYYDAYSLPKSRFGYTAKERSRTISSYPNLPQVIPLEHEVSESAAEYLANIFEKRTQILSSKMSSTPFESPEEQISSGLHDNPTNTSKNESESFADNEDSSFIYNTYQVRVKRSAQEKGEAIEAENDSKDIEGSDDNIDATTITPLNGFPGRG